MLDFSRKVTFTPYAMVFTVGLVLLASGLFLVRALWITETEHLPSPPHTSVVNLVDHPWYARQGFSQQDLKGFSPNIPGVIKIEQFPILLNSIFKIPPGDEINHFTLMVNVDLPAPVYSQSLILSLRQIGANWTVYLNGTQIHEEMDLDENGRFRRQRSLQNVLIPIPQRVVQAGPNTIVFHILGNAPTNPFFSGWQVGLSYSTGYQILPTGLAIKTRTVQDSFAWLQMSVYFFFGLLQVYLFFRQREIYVVYFFLFLFSCAFYSFSYSNLAFDLISDTAIINRMMFGVNFVWPALVGLTIWSYLYPEKLLSTGLKWIVGSNLIFTVCVWLVPYAWAETMMSVFLLVTTACAVYLLMMIIKAARDNIRDAKKILVSSCFIFVVIIWTVLDIFIFRTGVDLIGWAPFFLTVAFALIFIGRLWETTIELVESNRQITHMKDTMENQVIFRTRELQDANAILQERLHEINALQEDLRQMALRDALTGLYNRRFLDETLDREFALVKRKHLISLVMLDIDHFKILNDTFGHKAGDQVLKELSSFLISYFRQSDLLFRFGGEEFLIILPETRIADAFSRAKQLCMIIEQMVVHFEGQSIKITVSAGIAEMSSSDDTPDLALKRADVALYTAKNNGRNRVETANEPT